MKPNAPKTELVLPSALLAEVEAAADEENRPVSEVLRDLVECGLGERRWKAHAEEERQRGREAGLGLRDDDLSLTDDYRLILREKIAQGVRSLREGNVTDGESFMAQMDDELAALENRGR